MEYASTDIEWLMREYRATREKDCARRRCCRRITLKLTLIRQDNLVTAIHFECQKCMRKLRAELATPFCA